MKESLVTKPGGTFLLRFSDSEIGGLSIGWVSENADGKKQVNIIHLYIGKHEHFQGLEFATTHC